MTQITSGSETKFGRCVTKGLATFSIGTTPLVRSHGLLFHYAIQIRFLPTSKKWAMKRPAMTTGGIPQLERSHGRSRRRWSPQRQWDLLLCSPQAQYRIAPHCNHGKLLLNRLRKLLPIHPLSSNSTPHYHYMHPCHKVPVHSMHSNSWLCPVRSTCKAAHMRILLCPRHLMEDCPLNWLHRMDSWSKLHRFQHMQQPMAMPGPRSLGLIRPGHKPIPLCHHHQMDRHHLSPLHTVTYCRWKAGLMIILPCRHHQMDRHHQLPRHRTTCRMWSAGHTPIPPSRPHPIDHHHLLPLPAMKWNTCKAGYLRIPPSRPHLMDHHHLLSLHTVKYNTCKAARLLIPPSHPHPTDHHHLLSLHTVKPPKRQYQVKLHKTMAHLFHQTILLPSRKRCTVAKVAGVLGSRLIAHAHAAL